jgi:4-amino-4-deoxy-L-arabinose transferase-like glycosyltransferase
LIQTRSHWYWLGAILLFAGVVRLILIDQPFTRNSEGYTSYYGVRARNYFDWEWRYHGGLPIQSVGRLPGMSPTLYHHHPPLTFLSIAGSYLAFGQGEWQTRLPATLATLGCIVLVFILLHRAGRTRAGLIAGALFAGMPMVLYYGGHADVLNAQFVLWLLMCVWAYQWFWERPDWPRLAALCGAFLPAALTDWPAFYLLPILGLHYVCTRPWRTWGKIIVFGLWGTILFAGIYAHIAQQVDDWNWMRSKLERRTVASETDKGAAVSWRAWVRGAMLYNITQHTRPVLLLAFAWLALRGWRWRADDPSAQATRLLLAFALIHVIVGRQAVIVHDWWWWPLTPALAMAAGLMVEEMVKWIDGARRRYPQGGQPPDGERRPTSLRIGLLLAIAFVAMLAGWNAATVLPRFFDRRLTVGPMTFSAKELGDVIRACSSLNEAVMLAYDDRYDLPVWYYGNRSPCGTSTPSTAACATATPICPTAAGRSGRPRRWRW